MLSKEELLTKDISELENIAQSLGVTNEFDDDKEGLIYAILDRQADRGAAEQAAPLKRKRVRIAKKDTDRVYTVNGREGENFDVKKNKIKNEAPSLFKDLPAGLPEEEEEPAAEEEPIMLNEQNWDNMTPEEIMASIPKHRGRKSKAEQEAIARAEAYIQAREQRAAQQPNDEADLQHESEEPAQEARPVAVEVPDFIQEQAAARQSEIETAAEEDHAATDQDHNNLLAQLQAKVNDRKELPKEDPGMTEDGVWAGDPGDGTDFIVVEDLPIEDQGALPTFDIFDRPTTQPAAAAPASFKPVAAAPAQAGVEKFDFSDLVKANGVLEVMSDGYGFLRSSDYNYLSSPDDVYVSVQQVKHFGLKTGDVVECHVRPPHDGEKYFPLTSIDKINGRVPSEVRDRVPFEHLTPLFPDEKYMLCGNRATTNLSTRIVDLFAPIGKGQRALIVAQPKTGKTMLMKDVANAIAANHPEAYLMMLLIDERPEEVTDMARTVNAEVIASTFDEPAERHVKIAGLVLEKAKRMVECGYDVVIFLDSITRLARAYNTVAPASGKVLTGGVDANALQKPKRFFGAARNIEGGGSLTIIATALIDTGSKMDEVIFEEFKGTGNMELQLDRSLSNKRMFPAVNLVASSTRRDDLLQDDTTVNRMRILRQYIGDMTSIEAMNTIHDRMIKTRDNEEFLMSMNE
ncbi:MAG: transcription termination factor Rho [Prevotella sp.]|nr:transcription termination factor Rho [Prevotella sp.]